MIYLPRIHGYTHTNMDDLKVPAGIDENGKVVKAENAIKGITYRCICCSSELIFRAGAIRENHFSHKPNAYCNPETITHLLAKKLIINAIQENSTGNKEIVLIDTCAECNKEFNLIIPTKTFSKAAEEERVSAFTCDVVAYGEDNRILGIEIWETHKTDEIKAESLPIPWIELLAENVIENHFLWKPMDGRLKPTVCTHCKSREKKIIEVAKKWGINPQIFTTQKTPGIEPYNAELIKCFSCKAIIPVFWWKGVPFAQEEPPSPRPHTLIYRHSKTWGGSYYMNTCPNCHASQGDNYVFLLEGAPLRDFPMRRTGDTRTSNALIKKFLGLKKFY